MAAQFHLVGETIAVSASNGKITYLNISAHTDRTQDRTIYIKQKKKVGGALGGW